MHTNSESEFLGVHEVAKLLNCSPRTIYGWVSQGVIPFRKAGRKLLFDESEVRSWTKPEPSRYRDPILMRR